MGMSSGYPDWHKGVKADIVAQSLDKIAVDIVSQTIANLAVDVAAQTISELAINIKAQDLAELKSAITTQQAISVEWLFRTQTGNVSPGSSVSTEIYAPTGYIYEILFLRLQCSPPSGASTGTHSFFVSDTSYLSGILEGESTYDTELRYEYGYWMSANSYQYPTQEISQVMVLKGIYVDADTGLRIRYKNDTDVTQTNNRGIILCVRKIKVA